MMRDKYILNDKGEPVPEPSLVKWANWFADSNARLVKRDIVGSTTVSTVFLALDYNFGDKGPPVLWETMIVGGPLEGEQWRFSGTREQAEAQHQQAVEKVRRWEASAA